MMASRIALQPACSLPDGRLLSGGTWYEGAFFRVSLPTSTCCISVNGRDPSRYRERTLELECRFRQSLFRRRPVEKAMVLPRASLNFDYQIQRLAEMGQTLYGFWLRGVSSVQSQIPLSASDAMGNGFVDKISTNVSLTALAISAGATVYVTAVLHQKKSDAIRGKRDSIVDESETKLLLIMSPTPFNRFVLMRCPAIAYEETDVYQGLREKRLLEGRHHVSLEIQTENCCRTVLREASRDENTKGGFARNRQTEEEQKGSGTLPVFQRTCLHTEDGGVLAIDWPCHLELSGEHGLDTTFLLIPGSASGSGDKNVQNFVRRSLKSGYFPIVVNPRGCAGSPLTTPRLFSAGDSDDINMAVHFVSQTRPWATIMAVGWGYGANMLVKYLGEAAAATPLTAAAGIKIPFDLGESDKSFGHDQGLSVDQQLKNDFVQILQSNQLIFEGKAKGFDVQKGLSARTLREFDATISRVAHGFDLLEEFYKNLSCTSWIDKVKIPLLCIQDDECTTKTLSIPHKMFEENPFTTLMLFLSRGHNIVGNLSFKSGGGEVWDSLVIEWLAAVELAFLKGRHPMLQGIDIAIKPLKDWPLLKSPESIDKKEKDPFNGYFKGNSLSENAPRSKQRLHTNTQPKIKDNKDMAEHTKGSDNKATSQNGIIMESKGSGGDDQNSTNAVHEAGHEDGASAHDTEMDRVTARQAAESVMKVLDVTMPRTLSGEKKQQVLDAVEKGETVVTALQEACPVDVQEKMKTAVSAAVQARGMSLQSVGFGKNRPAPKVPEEMKEQIQKNLNLIAHDKFTAKSGEFSRLDEKKPESSSSDSKGDNATVSQEVQHHARGIGDEKKPESRSSDSKASSASVSQEVQHHAQGKGDEKKPDSSSSEAKGASAVVSEDDTNVTKEQGRSSSEISDISSQLQGQTQITEVQHETISESGAAREVTDTGVGESKVSTEGKSMEVENQNNTSGSQSQKTHEPGQKSDNSETMPQTKEAGPDVSGAVKKTDVSPDSVSNQEDQNIQNIGTKSEDVAPPQTFPPTPAPPIGMSGAFEALTGVDDSTQMAVTNVFGVIDNMLEQVGQNQQQERKHLNQPSNSKDHQGSGTQEHSSKELRKQITTDGLHEDSSVDSLNESRNDSLDMGPQHKVNMSSEDEMVIAAEMTSNSGSITQKGTGILSSKESDSSENDLRVMVDTYEKPMEARSTMGDMKKDSFELPLGHKNSSQLEDSKKLLVKNDERSSTNTTARASTHKLDLGSESSNRGHEAVAMEYSRDENAWTLGGLKSSSMEELESVSENPNHNPEKIATAETANMIEPSYLISEDELNSSDVHNCDHGISEGHNETRDPLTEGSVCKDTHNESRLEKEQELRNRVRELTFDALHLELLRKLGDTGMDSLGMELDNEIKTVASAVAAASGLNMVRGIADGNGVNNAENHGGQVGHIQSQGDVDEREGMHVETIVQVIFSVYGETSIIPKLMPAGVLVGVVLAALNPSNLASSDHIQNDQNSRQSEEKMPCDKEELPHNGSVFEVDHEAKSAQDKTLPPEDHDITESLSNDPEKIEEPKRKMDFLSQNIDLSSHINNGKDSDGNAVTEKEKSPVNDHMMTAVAGAMGVTAILGSQGSSPSSTQQYTHQQASSEPANVGRDILNAEDNANNAGLVTSLAERAISMATPIVPTKEDGGVDHDRLVTVLVGLGQKGGILRFVGKVALLWGGLRAAMNLTGRLLVFLHISDRPLYQRLMGFLLMALLLWTPIIVPLLPALLQQWASKSPIGVTRKAAVIGLYCAFPILVAIWGRHVRGYNMPLSQYGLKLHSHSKGHQLRTLISGLAMGFCLVSSFYLLGISLGLIQFSWMTNLYISSTRTITCNLASSWRIAKLVVYSLGLGLALSVVEELLFRSWLHEEIEVDLGFHRAAVLSGFIYAISHWSLPLVPGLWLLSLLLIGARVRYKGDLDLAIGLHAGLIAGNRIINLGGLVKHAASAPSWFTGASTGNPLAGLFGVYVVGILALVSYPWNHIWRQKDTIQADVHKSLSTT